MLPLLTLDRTKDPPHSYEERSQHDDHPPSRVRPAQDSGVYDAIDGENTQTEASLAQSAAGSAGESQETVASSSKDPNLGTVLTTRATAVLDTSRPRYRSAHYSPVRQSSLCATCD